MSIEKYSHLEQEGRLRIVAIIDTWSVSGPGRQLTASAREMLDQGIDFRVIMFQRSSRSAAPFSIFLQNSGVPFEILEEKGPLDLGVMMKVTALLKTWEPDIVQTHSYRATAFIAAIRVWQRTWRWIAFFHGDTDENWKVRMYHRVERLLFPRADFVVVMSQLHRSRFRGIEEKVRVIYNACLPARNSPGGSVDRAPPQSVPLVAVVGRLSFEKGVDIFVRAFATLAPGIGAHAVIIGEGPERSKLQQMVSDLGLIDKVTFMGEIFNVDPLYKKFAVVVVPSRSEGLPNVLLEAIRSDVPVVATSVGAVPEVLQDHAAGELVKPGDAEALARAIERALASGFSIEARRARAAAAERFSLRNRVAQLASLYAAAQVRNPSRESDVSHKLRTRK